MPVIRSQEIRLAEIDMEGVVGALKADVISQREGWESNTLRLFRLEPNGHTPRHQHPWEHVNYVTTGKGRLRVGGSVYEIAAGDFAFVPPDTDHQFENPYSKPFEFLCVVPASAA